MSPWNLLLDAADRYERLDARLARETYLEALSAALLGHRAGPADPLRVARAARGVPPPCDRGASDLLLEGLATLIAEGYQAGAPALRHAVSVFRHGDVPGDEQLRWLFAATHGAVDACWLASEMIQVASSTEAASQTCPWAGWTRPAWGTRSTSGQTRSMTPVAPG